MRSVFRGVRNTHKQWRPNETGFSMSFTIHLQWRFQQWRSKWDRFSVRSALHNHNASGCCVWQTPSPSCFWAAPPQTSTGIAMAADAPHSSRHASGRPCLSVRRTVGKTVAPTPCPETTGSARTSGRASPGGRCNCTPDRSGAGWTPS